METPGTKDHLKPEGKAASCDGELYGSALIEPHFADWGDTDGLDGVSRRAPRLCRKGQNMCGWSSDTDVPPGGDGDSRSGPIDDAALPQGTRRAPDAPAAAGTTPAVRHEENEDTLLRFAFGDR